MNIRKNILLLISILLCTCLGCSVAQVSLPAFTETLTRGEYASAKGLAQKEIGRRNDDKDLLWNLQVASLERLLKQYAASNISFDRAEGSFRRYDQQAFAGKSVQASKGIFFNDSATPYTGKMHDRVMVNTYKALNYALLGDAQRARVEFNRALYRQNKIKQFFSVQAEKIKVQPSGDETAKATLNNPELDQIINERYKSLNNFKVYSRFVNPFTTYIAGLFFWLEGDAPKAIDILKEAYALNSENKTVAADFARAARGDVPSRELWIIFENGLAPRREEMRIDIPLISEGFPVKYIGIALPNLTLGLEAYPSLTLSAGLGEPVTTEPLANMENSILAEFRKELPAIITHEVSRAALKTYLQYKLQRNYGDLGGIAGGLYQAITTAVDTRSWTALPYDFQLAHMPIPEDGLVTAHPPGGAAITINIPLNCKNVILYVRIVARGTEPVYDLITF